MTTLSQQDPRWASIPLGTSNVTIGTHGCTITSLAIILGTTPSIVNERLKEFGGFKDGNLVIWAKIADAFPGVTVRREWSYNNEDVAANLPAIVEVDGSPIGAPKHFVVYIGNQQLIDPWTGLVEPTSKYNALSYAVIKGTWNQAQPTEDYFEEDGFKLNYADRASMFETFRLWVKAQKGLLIDAAHAITPEVFKSQVDATSLCQTQLKTALEQNEKYQQQVDSLQKENNEVKSKHEESERSVVALKNEIAEIHKQDANYGQEALDAQHKVTELEKSINTIAEAADIPNKESLDLQQLTDVVAKEVVKALDKDNTQIPYLYLEDIVKQLVNRGLNKYLVEEKGLQPIDINQPITPEAVEKVKQFIDDAIDTIIELDKSSQTGTQTFTPQVVSTDPRTGTAAVTSAVTKKKNPFTFILETWRLFVN